MAKLTPAEKQKAYRERKALAKTTTRFPSAEELNESMNALRPKPEIERRVDRIEALMKAQERRIQDLEDGRAPEVETPTDRSDSRATGIPMTLDVVRRQIAAVPPTRDTLSAGPRLVNGKPLRSCCPTIEGMAHTDTCEVIGCT